MRDPGVTIVPYLLDKLYDMVKNELGVTITSYYLHMLVTNWKLKSTSWNSRVGKWEFKSTSYEFKSKSYEF